MLSSYVFVENLRSYYRAFCTEAFKLKLFLKLSLEHQKQTRVQAHSMIPIGKKDSFTDAGWFLWQWERHLFPKKKRGPILKHGLFVSGCGLLIEKLLIFTEIKSNIIVVFTTLCIHSRVSAMLWTGLRCVLSVQRVGLSEWGRLSRVGDALCVWLQPRGCAASPASKPDQRLPLHFSMGASTMNLKQCKSNSRTV